MSAGHDDGKQFVAIAVGSLLPAIAGGVVGLFAASMFWPLADPNSAGWGAAFGRMFAGVCVGGISSFAVAWFMAWHASAVAAVPDRPDAAAMWGAIPGALFGFTLAPLFAAVLGWYFGHLLSAVFFGMFFGPIAGVVGWEIAFFLTVAMQPRHGH